MSLISENIIPGKQGKVFRTDANEQSDLECIKQRLLSLDGIKDVEIKMEVFPREFKVYTTKLISVEDIENKVKTTSFHAILKDNIEL